MTPDKRLHEVLKDGGALKDEVVVVVANGPSLLRQDLGWLLEAKTIAVNRAYRLPAHNPTAEGWAPDFACWIDHTIARQGSDPWHPNVYAGCRGCFVASLELRRAEPTSWGNSIPFDLVKWDGKPLGREYAGVVKGGSSTIAAVHLAFLMGARRVEVIGVDHQYDEAGRSHFYSEPNARLHHSPEGTEETWGAMVVAWSALAASWPGKVSRRSPADVTGLGDHYPRGRPVRAIAPTATEAPPTIEFAWVDINPVTSFDTASEFYRGGKVVVRRGNPVKVSRKAASFLLEQRDRRGRAIFVEVSPRA